VRVPKELKERMDAFRGAVDWSEEIRAFVERGGGRAGAGEGPRGARAPGRKAAASPEGLALGYVREDLG
jgi:hypothetical protein